MCLLPWFFYRIFAAWPGQGESVRISALRSGLNAIIFVSSSIIHRPWNPISHQYWIFLSVLSPEPYVADVWWHVVLFCHNQGLLWADVWIWRRWYTCVGFLLLLRLLTSLSYIFSFQFCLFIALHSSMCLVLCLLLDILFKRLEFLASSCSVAIPSACDLAGYQVGLPNISWFPFENNICMYMQAFMQ